MTCRTIPIANPPRAPRRVVASLLFTVAIAGCSSGNSAAGGSGTGGGTSVCKNVVGAKVTVVTKQFDFKPGCLTLAGTSLSVRYDNAEKGIQHNFHLRGAKSDSGVDRTDLKVGPDVQTITYVDLKPGTYTYVCDLHPAMKGKLTVTASLAPN